MVYNPGISFFISFRDLDPSSQNQCIFYTQKGTRCRHRCSASDNARARDLCRAISLTALEPICSDMLRDYILLNCCRMGANKHRERIKEENLLVPLTQRWQNEICGYTEYRTPMHMPSPGRCGQCKYAHPAAPSYAYARMPSNFSSATINESMQNSIYDPETDGAARKNEIVPNRIHDSSWKVQCNRHEGSNENSVEAFVSQQRYNLRSYHHNSAVSSISTQDIPNPQPPLSEFHQHIKDPRPTDSVFYKLLSPLKNRDYKDGSLYIFDRTSSPGHVKIGWTSRTVSCRLNEWSKCGYKPNLLFSVSDVPQAQRVETLAHYELIKEWRREWKCNEGRGCGKSHKEWFEVSIERAEQVMENWTEIMRRVEPYDSHGQLKPQWVEAAESMVRDGGNVTSKGLLECYEASLTLQASQAQESSLTNRSAAANPQVEAEPNGEPAYPRILAAQTTPSQCRVSSQLVPLPYPTSKSRDQIAEKDAAQEVDRNATSSNAVLAVGRDWFSKSVKRRQLWRSLAIVAKMCYRNEQVW